LELYWSYTGAINYRAVGCAGGGVARPLAAVGRRTGQVSGRAERSGGVGWIGWSFWLWLFGLARVLAEVKDKSPAIEGQPATKITKITKIPIVVYVLGS